MHKAYQIILATLLFSHWPKNQVAKKPNMLLWPFCSVFPGRNPDRGNTELCNDRGRGFDTIVTTDDRQTFVFKNNKYWRLTDDSIAPGYPRTISSDWRGLSRNLNAAFTWTNGKTYFFKKSMYWRFSNQTMDEGYPKRISSGFEGIPDDIDAAFVWSGNAKIYFFKGSNYWRFDPDQSPPVKSSYPRPISNWNGIPDNINAAMLYKNGFTYFFKENNYWRFNDRAFSVQFSFSFNIFRIQIYLFRLMTVIQLILETRHLGGLGAPSDLNL